MSDQHYSPGNNSLTPMDIDVNASTSTPDTTSLNTNSTITGEFKSPQQAASIRHDTDSSVLSQPQHVPQERQQQKQQPETLLKATLADRTTKLPDIDKREKTLAEFLTKMDNYSPIIPDAVTDYYLSRAGLDCDDVRVKRLLALAAQKFISDISQDAFQYCKVRQSGNRSKVGKDRKTVLTMEDLSAALAEYGVNTTKNMTTLATKYIERKAKKYARGRAADLLNPTLQHINDPEIVALQEEELAKLNEGRSWWNRSARQYSQPDIILNDRDRDILDAVVKSNWRNAIILEDYLMVRRRDEIRAERGVSHIQAKGVGDNKPMPNHRKAPSHSNT
ncbi:hypothetical protein [Absidia glauca]|uniref:Transcription initiation factor TFIID subunit 10 n=1 Tax=Absidia glauca TaxID=4829 RepID=A0A163J1U9_ABSGL|nr:hypothetical protein [Absidia glauca]